MMLDPTFMDSAMYRVQANKSLESCKTRCPWAWHLPSPKGYDSGEMPDLKFLA
jgi:hypothetical protein